MNSNRPMLYVEYRTAGSQVLLPLADLFTQIYRQLRVSDESDQLTLIILAFENCRRHGASNDSTTTTHFETGANPTVEWNKPFQ